MVLENYNNNKQQFNRLDFLIMFSLIIWYIDFEITTYILNVHIIIDFKRYPRTYFLMQGRCFICSNF